MRRPRSHTAIVWNYDTRMIPKLVSYFLRTRKIPYKVMLEQTQVASGDGLVEGTRISMFSTEEPDEVRPLRDTIEEMMRFLKFSYTGMEYFVP